MANSKAHQRYNLADGRLVVGVTTALNLLAKPALVPWANKLGLQGVDVNKYVDDKAAIGSLAHLFVMSHFNNVKADVSDYSKNQIDLAENALLSFFEWEKSRKIEPILTEAQLVSEKYEYGGTIDLYCKLDGIYTLIDFKTGKGIYSEMEIQLAAYKALLEENGHEVEQAKILRIGRDETEGFEEKSISKLDKQFELFWHCVAIYYLQNQIKKGM